MGCRLPPSLCRADGAGVGGHMDGPHTVPHRGPRGESAADGTISQLTAHHYVLPEMW